jgi:hypothetical protein
VLVQRNRSTIAAHLQRLHSAFAAKCNAIAAQLQRNCSAIAALSHDVGLYVFLIEEKKDEESV